MTLHGMIFIVSSLSSKRLSFVIDPTVMTRFSAEFRAEKQNKRARVLATLQALL